MRNDLEHPEITCARRTGFPSWAQPDEDEYEEDDECCTASEPFAVYDPD